MMIRSQDRKSLVDIESVFVDKNNTEIYGTTKSGHNTVLLGVYKTVEEVADVMNYIQSFYVSLMMVWKSDCIFNNIVKDTNRSDWVHTLTHIFIYFMPNDLSKKVE